MIILSILLAVFGLGIFVVGALAVAGKLPGNGVVGLRIPEVRKSQQMWTLGHRIAGPAWLGSGLAMLAAALLATSASGWAWIIVVGLGLGSLFLLGMGAALASHTLAQMDAKAQKEAASDSGCCSAGGAGDSVAANASNDSCCTPSGAGEPSADECASGQACGSCSLNGSCEGGGTAFDATRGSQSPSQPPLDMEAARRAMAARDTQ